jgi:acetaldehyde/propanal dehydrogenase
VFDATSACVHAENSHKVNEQGTTMIVLKPAAIGPCFVPTVKSMQHVGQRERDFNMATCGGQGGTTEVAVTTMARELGQLMA